MRERIEIDRVALVMSHPCKMTKRPDNHKGGWTCDLITGATKCLSGITNYNTIGYEGWYCAKCDFDLCKKCMQADRFIEMVTGRED